jgi:DNA repair protein RAD50
VKEVAGSHNMSGYDSSPLEENKITEFVDRLHEMVRRAESDLKKLTVRSYVLDRPNYRQTDK